MTRGVSASLYKLVEQAIRAYELIQTSRLKTEQKAEDDFETAKIIGNAEQYRFSLLLREIQKGEEAALQLLKKTSLVHLSGTPFSLKEKPTDIRRNDEFVSSLFAEVQLAISDLNTTLLQLANAFLEAQQWEQARNVIQPLIEVEDSPFYKPALDLLCASHNLPSIEALNAGNLEIAYEGFKIVQELDDSYEDVRMNITELLYQQGLQCIADHEWLRLIDLQKKIINLIPHYKDIDEWSRKYPLSPPACVLSIPRKINKKPSLNGIVQSVVFSDDSRNIILFGESWIEIWDIYETQKKKILNIDFSYFSNMKEDNKEMIANKMQNFYSQQRDMEILYDYVDKLEFKGGSLKNIKYAKRDTYHAEGSINYYSSQMVSPFTFSLKFSISIRVNEGIVELDYDHESLEGNSHFLSTSVKRTKEEMGIFRKSINFTSPEKGIFKVMEYKKIMSTHVHTDGYNDSDISPDGRFVATLGKKDDVRIWELNLA